ncbi:hypothetical protein [Streptomyces sp. MZ04]|uniref:hypothetical protein n=1 Tax=Streptomyces sp. MZ04 TaxID=2559236 RepID=UPI00107EE2A0|nr:hypothetical protein [Streptomyces sp. MZ04]TGB05759.1 hypothetical protein E2651_24280 [Streptomyces sp. MZ04]
MITLKRAAALTVASGLLTIAGAAPSGAAANDVDPKHHITCKWNKRAGTPYSPSAKVVTGFVQVHCSDSLDNANTRAQVQIFRGGKWKNQGNGVTSHKTSKVIHVNDKSAKRIGNWRYRTKGTHFGQHGNIWTLPTFYSPSRMLWRKG